MIYILEPFLGVNFNRSMTERSEIQEKFYFKLCNYLNPEVLQKNPLKAPPSRHFRTFQVLKFISQATHT